MLNTDQVRVKSAPLSLQEIFPILHQRHKRSRDGFRMHLEGKLQLRRALSHGAPELVHHLECFSDLPSRPLPKLRWVFLPRLELTLRLARSKHRGSRVRARRQLPRGNADDDVRFECSTYV